MNFKDFKAKSSALTEAVSKMAEKPKNKYHDDRVWNVTKDSAGNGSATLRILPQKDTSKSPIFLGYRHSCQPEGRWFIEECPHTIGEKCPICEHSSSIWNSDEETARVFWRKKQYVANIYIVSDEGNPENEGKVFLFKFGKKIYDLIMEAVAPEDPDDEARNVFDFDEGFDFKLKLTQKAGYNNYDKSKFVSKATAIADGDIKLQEEVYNSIYDLSEFEDKEKFKSYDDLLKKLSGFVNSVSAPTQSLENQVKEEVAETPQQSQSTQSSQPVKDEDEDIPFKTDEDEDDDEFDFDSLLSDDDD